MKKIPLTQSKYALVDDEDYVILSMMNWRAHVNKWGNWYAWTRVDRKQISMHRFIINPPNNFLIDHKDGDGLNNTKINLRACTHGQNNTNTRLKRANTSGFKGVDWRRKDNLWRAAIRFNGTKIHLGQFSTKEEAAKKYDEAAIKYHGEFARTNKDLGLLN